MKGRRNYLAIDTVLILLCTACVALSIMLVIAKPLYLIPVLVALLIVAAVLFVFVQKTRKNMRILLNGRAAADNAAFSGITTLSLPVVALKGKTILWYNDAFVKTIAQGRENCLLPLNRVVPGVDFVKTASEDGQDMKIGQKRFTAYGNAMQAENDLFFIIFVEDTLLKTASEEYFASRPAVLYFTIDTYDDILKNMKESQRAIIISNIDLALEKFIGKGSGFLRRISSSRYLAVVEERQVQQMIASRFDVLDEVRKADGDAATVSMSIGVGQNGETLKRCEEMAGQALDMALGRGGDQAAVKSRDGFEFYGGVSRSVERRTKVKSRVVASAISELMTQYDRVLIMGHRESDMDSVGAAVGMLRFCRICEKPAAIVIDAARSLAGSLINLMVENGYGDDMISPEEALALTGPKTLLVVVDTHIHYLLESDEVYRSCGGTVVIDHHRRMVGHIENALIFYHEPYASSASELVSELLQYVGVAGQDKPTPAEAEALLAGIMLDTRTFSLHVGVRTFEAAAYLRRMGAQTGNVKKLFASSMNDYLYRSHLVSQAKMYESCAIAMSDKVPLECEVVAPQAANELLTIEGVYASFVGILRENVVRLSARSMGDVNVQLIMEKIGGGGHLTMAGAQLAGLTLEQAEQQLRQAISEYMRERTHTKK